MERLLTQLTEAVQKYRLWQKGETLLVAFSGGPDSTALLHGLSLLAPQQQLKLIAAHVNHGFRGAEAAAEAAAAKAFCAGLGIHCETVALDVPAYSASRRMNAQAAARELRYAFLQQMALRHGAACIVFGHHADDQAETVLLRLLRGTGSQGLGGMRPLREVLLPEADAASAGAAPAVGARAGDTSAYGARASAAHTDAARTDDTSAGNAPAARTVPLRFARPLLGVPKAELLAYCARHELSYSVDSSNAHTDYTRNWVRHEVLPLLQQRNPALPQALVRLAETSAAEDDWLMQQTLELFRLHAHSLPGGFRLPRAALTGSHLALQRRLIKLILNYLSLEKEGIAYAQIEAVRLAALQEAPSSWSADLGGGIRFSREKEELLWVRETSLQMTPGAFSYEMEAGCRKLWLPEADAVLQMEVCASSQLSDSVRGSADRYEAWFDLQALIFPLYIRSRRPGDRMSVLGLNGTKKVQDLLVDHKVPRALRDRLPLVCDGSGRLLWVPGVRRSSVALVGAATELVVRLQLVATPLDDNGKNGAKGH